MALIPIPGTNLLRDTETGLVVRSEAELKKLREKQPNLADLQGDLQYLRDQVVAHHQESKETADGLMILTCALLEVTPELRKLVPDLRRQSIRCLWNG